MDEPLRVRATRDIKMLGGRHVWPAGSEGTVVDRYTDKQPHARPMYRVLVRWDADPDAIWDEPSDALVVLV